MLKRQLRYSVDSFAAFFRLGAQCWGLRIADPELEIKLASEDPVKQVEMIRLEAEISGKALKRKEQMAAYRRAKRAKWPRPSIMSNFVYNFLLTAEVQSCATLELLPVLLPGAKRASTIKDTLSMSERAQQTYRML